LPEFTWNALPSIKCVAENSRLLVEGGVVPYFGVTVLSSSSASRSLRVLWPEDEGNSRGAQIPLVWLPRQLTFVQRHLIFAAKLLQFSCSLHTETLPVLTNPAESTR